MYRFLCSGVMTYADRWAVDGTNLVAISCTATQVPFKTVQQIIGKGLESQHIASMLYDNDNPSESPGHVSMSLLHNDSKLIDQRAVPGRPGYRNMFAWAFGDAGIYYVVMLPGQEADAPRLWHRMVEERTSSNVISLRDWGPKLWDELKDLGRVATLKAHNLIAYRVKAEDKWLQERICVMVKDGELPKTGPRGVYDEDEEPIGIGAA